MMNILGYSNKQLHYYFDYIFAVSLLLFSLPESPKFLLKQGKSNQSLKVITDIFHANTGRSKSHFPVDQLEDDSSNSISEGKTAADEFGFREKSSAITTVIQNTFALFSRKLWVRSGH